MKQQMHCVYGYYTGTINSAIIFGSAIDIDCFTQCVLTDAESMFPTDLRHAIITLQADKAIIRELYWFKLLLQRVFFTWQNFHGRFLTSTVKNYSQVLILQ